MATAGCHHRPLAAAVPAIPPQPVMVSIPPVTHPSEPLAEIPLEDVANPELQLPRKPLPRFRPLRATRAQLAAIKPVASQIDLGQLTAGGEAASGTLRQQTEDLLRNQQRRLAAVPSGIAVSHSQQVQQAKLFLTQADDAWKKQDVEGARTLATKAKVLLDELDV